MRFIENRLRFLFVVYKYRWNRLLTNVTSLTTFTIQLDILFSLPTKNMDWCTVQVYLKLNRIKNVFADADIDAMSH